MATPEMLTEEEEALWSAATINDVPLDTTEDDIVTDDPSIDEPNEEDIVNTEEHPETPEEVIEEDNLDEGADPVTEPEEKDSTDVNLDEGDTQTDDKSTTDVKTETQGLRPLKANGMEMAINDIEELYALASQGMNYTQKTQKLAPRLKDMSAMDENGITSSDLALLIDAKGGNKEALAKLIQQAGVDTLDIEEDDASKYVAKEYGSDAQQLELQEIYTNISTDPEYAVTEKIVDHQWDAGSRDAIRNNPKMLTALHNHVKNGTYAKVAPEAAKLAAMDGYTKTNVEYYELAGEAMFKREQEFVKANTQVAQKTEATRKDKRKAAAVPKGKTTAQVTDEKLDFMNMPDDEYMKHYNRVMSRA